MALRIQSTAHAFAALLADGSVVTWGGRQYGGQGPGANGKGRVRGKGAPSQSRYTYVYIGCTNIGTYYVIITT